MKAPVAREESYLSVPHAAAPPGNHLLIFLHASLETVGNL
jgi:hypothetical protein